ncbi:MAG TPA: hypothetical protein VKT78_17395 [Fimbriimonadaceae bacterium]|nr:hypothetical protein [Fimbriimonadaceae bacterium]
MKRQFTYDGFNILRNTVPASSPSSPLHESTIRHTQKSLIEQIGVVRAHQQSGAELDIEFVRSHGLAIVQLCEELLHAGARAVGPLS